MVLDLGQGKYKRRLEHLVVPEIKEVLKKGGGMPKGQPGQLGGVPHGQRWNNLNKKMIVFRLYLIDQNKYPPNK